MICDNMTALPYSKSNKDKDFHVALWNKCTIETECQLHYNMNWFTYDTLYREGPSLCICDSGTHSNRGSRCENYVCTTYYRHVRFTPFNIAVPWATNYMVPDPAEEFSKQGARAPNTTLPGYHDCIWFRHWQCQMPQRQTGGPRSRCDSVQGRRHSVDLCPSIDHHQCSVVRTKCEWSEQ